MITPSRAGSARRQAEILVKRRGEPVTLKWTDWPNGKPATDETTGAAPQSGQQTPVERTVSFKALVHFIAPTVTGVRQHQEVQVGDAIVDFVPTLCKVTAVGSTALTVGQLLSIYDFNAANRALSTGQTAATKTDVDLWSLEDPRFLINGQIYVQKPVGENLQRSWDAQFAGLTFSRPFLLRKAT